ncbi:hypothetical protein MNBD_GAMMA01-1647, partial [hydrothermal vent metagenome]
KLILLLATLLNHDSYMVKQGDVSVPLADLDSYVYLLSPEKRFGFAEDKFQIEDNIITILNINIVYDYIVNSELNSDPLFQPIQTIVNTKEINLDNQFYEKLDINKNLAYDNVRNFIKKKEYYMRMRTYLKNKLDDGEVNELSKEYFLLNSSNWIIPERRSLSMIQIKPKSSNFNNIESIYSELAVNPSEDNFEKIALKYSDDPTVKLNKGNLSYFKRADLNFPFTEKIFQAPTGLMSNIFKSEGSYYLIRINSIKEQIKPKYNDFEKQIKNQLVDEVAEKQFQNIINRQGNNPIEINQELMAHVFERYKVFNE